MVRNAGRIPTRRTGLNSASKRMLEQQRSQAGQRRLVTCAVVVGVLFGLSLMFGHEREAHPIDANPGPAAFSDDGNPVSDWMGSERSRSRVDAIVDKMANGQH